MTRANDNADRIQLYYNSSFEEYREENAPQLRKLLGVETISHHHSAPITVDYHSVVNLTPKAGIPKLNMGGYVWSTSLQHNDIALIDDKTIEKSRRNGVMNQSLMDRPMSTGKHIWHIELGVYNGGDCLIGVCPVSNNSKPSINENTVLDFVAYDCFHGYIISKFGDQS